MTATIPKPQPPDDVPDVPPEPPPPTPLEAWDALVKRMFAWASTPRHERPKWEPQP